MDINGRVVFSSKNFSNDHALINTQSGFYFIEFEKEKIIKRIKIIVN